MNPGDTGSRAGKLPPSREPLNEGRDVNPGDTANCMQELHPGETVLSNGRWRFPSDASAFSRRPH